MDFPRSRSENGSPLQSRPPSSSGARHSGESEGESAADVPREQPTQTVVGSNDPLFEAIADEYAAELRGGRTPELQSWLERVPPEQRESLREFLAAVRQDWEVQAAEVAAAADAGIASGFSLRPPLDRQLIEAGLITPAELKEALRAVSREGRVKPADLREELVRRELVTRWQWKELAAGRTRFQVDGGRYVLLEQIGQGGMGAVYKARHVRMKRIAALKVIRPEALRETQLKARFRREVDVCSRLQHEHIVQTVDVGEDDQGLYLVMEYVEGSDLAGLVKREGVLSPGEAAAIGLQAAAGLAYAHASGVVHRDIKPQNLLLSTAGSVKILDMGLARLTDTSEGDDHTSLTHEGTVMGTVDYMAPEQARDTHRADQRSDLYSLGATLYYLLVGRPPFAGGTLLEKLTRLANDSPPSVGQFRVDCPAPLIAVIDRLLAKRPEERFQSAEELVRALQPLAAKSLAGGPAVTAAVQALARTGAETVPAAEVSSFTFVDSRGTLDRLQRSRPRRRWWPGAAAAVLAAAGIIGLALWRAPSRSREEAAAPVGQSTAESLAAIPPVRITRELPGPYGGTSSVVWSPDGEYIATAGDDGDVWLHDAVHEVQPARVYRGHAASILALHWSSNGTWIASADIEQELHIWKTSNLERQHQIHLGGSTDPNAPNRYWDTLSSFRDMGCDFSPDGSRFVYTKGNSLHCLQTSDWSPVWETVGLSGRVKFSPSGKFLGVVNLSDWSGPAILDAGTGRLLGTAPGIPAAEGNEPALEITSKVFGFTPEDDLVVAVPGRVFRWKRNPSGAYGPAPEATFGLPLEGYDRNWNLPRFPLALSPQADRMMVFSGSRAVECNLMTGNQREWPHTFPAAGTGVDYHFRKRQLAMGGWLADFETGKGRRFPYHGQNISASGRWFPSPELHSEFLVVPAQNSRSLWNLRTGRRLGPRLDLSWINPLRILPNGDLRSVEANVIVTRAWRNDRWEDSGGEAVSLQGADDRGYLGFSPDGTLLVGPSRVWDCATGVSRPWPELGERTKNQLAGIPFGPQPTVQAAILALATGTSSGRPHQPFDEFPTLAADFPSERIGFSANGTWLAGVKTDNHFGRHLAAVVHLPTGRRSVPVHATSQEFRWDPHCVDVSVSGRYLLMTREIWDLQADPPALVWRAPPDRNRRLNPIHGTTYRWGALWPDERHVVVAQDASFQLWDFLENRLLATLYRTGDTVDDWIFVNEQTRHFSAAPNSEVFVRLTHPKAGPDDPPLSPTEYRRKYGWKPNPAKVPLNLPPPAADSPRESAAN